MHGLRSNGCIGVSCRMCVGSEFPFVCEVCRWCVSGVCRVVMVVVLVVVVLMEVVVVVVLMAVVVVVVI